MSERFTIELGDATHAVDYNQLTALLHGYGHVDGFGYQLVDGTDLEFGAGEAFVDGTVVSGGAQTLTFGDEIEPAGELPRKDVIVVDGNGDLVVETGIENEQIGGSGRGSRMPSPFPLVELSGTPVAEVWVDKYVVELEASDVTDRRLTSELDVHTFSAVSAAFEEASVSNAPVDDKNVVRKAETDALSNDLDSAVDSLEEGKADDPHDLAGNSHEPDTLDNLNSKVSDATLDDESSSRPPDNHASEHHDGGDDEIDAADFSGSSGQEDQFLKTDGSSAAWVNPPGGITVDDFNFENGSSGVSSADDSFTLSFDETYEQNAAVPVVMNETTSFTDNGLGAWFGGWQTDSNGDYTGMQVNTYDGDNDDDGRAHWAVMGVTV